MCELTGGSCTQLEVWKLIVWESVGHIVHGILGNVGRVCVSVSVRESAVDQCPYLCCVCTWCVTVQWGYCEAQAGQLQQAWT